MILFTDQQKEKIKGLNPLSDSKFKYNASKWVKLNSDYKYHISEFADREISRQDVIDAYKAYFASDDVGFMKAFLLTMVWGFADTGYGTYRTNKYLSDKENLKKIENALSHIRSGNHAVLKNAFNELTKIKGLGISYLTKILYFATRAVGQENYALIFDIRVATALVKFTAPKEIHQLITVLPSTKFADYEAYNQLIHKLAKENEVSAEQLEMYLFNQDFE